MNPPLTRRSAWWSTVGTRNSAGQFDVYAPHGYADLFTQHVRPNPLLAPREVYERKVARWVREWPQLAVEPWPDGTTH